MKKIVIVASRRRPTQGTVEARRMAKAEHRKKLIYYEAYRQKTQMPSTKNFDCSPAGIKRNERCCFADSQLSEAAITIRECLGKSGD